MPPLWQPRVQLYSSATGKMPRLKRNDICVFCCVFITVPAVINITKLVLLQVLQSCSLFITPVPITKLVRLVCECLLGVCVLFITAVPVIKLFAGVFITSGKVLRVAM